MAIFFRRQRRAKASSRPAPARPALGLTLEGLEERVVPTVPFVQSITGLTTPLPGTTNNTNATALNYQVVFTLPVNNVDITDFTVRTVGTPAVPFAPVPVVTSVTPMTVAGLPAGQAYMVTVNPGIGQGSLRLDLDDNDSITNGPDTLAGTGTGTAAGGNGTGTNGSKQGFVYVVDNNPPAVTAPALVAASDSGTVGDKITNVSRPMFTGTAEANSTVTITSDKDGVLGTVTATAGGTYSFTPSMDLSEGTYFIRATATDSFTNSATMSQSFTFDRTKPKPNIGLAGGTDPATGTQVQFQVTFNEPVTGFAATDVGVGGTSGASMVTVSGMGATYTLTVTGMTQSGTIVLDIPAGAAIDTAGNTSAAAIQASVGYSIGGGGGNNNGGGGGNNNGGGGGSSPVLPPTGVGQIAQILSQQPGITLALGDVTGDRVTDLVFASKSGPVAVIIDGATGTVAGILPIFIRGPRSRATILVADVDGNGKAEVITMVSGVVGSRSQFQFWDVRATGPVLLGSFVG